MKQVHQHPDGLIFVRTDGGTYSDTPENVTRDFGVTPEPLPEGADERVYEPDRRHAIQNRETIIAGGPMPWPFGDDLIARVQTGLASKKIRDDALAKQQQEEMMAKLGIKK